MSEKFYTIVCHDTKNGELVSIMSSKDLSDGELKNMKNIKKQLGEFDNEYPYLKYTWLGAVTSQEAKEENINHD